MYSRSLLWLCPEVKVQSARGYATCVMVSRLRSLLMLWVRLQVNRLISLTSCLFYDLFVCFALVKFIDFCLCSIIVGSAVIWRFCVTVV